MHERELRGEALVGEVGVERLELERRDHALVDDRAARQRREVHVELALGALAQAEGLPVERDAGERLAARRRRGWRRRRAARSTGIAPRARVPSSSGRTGTSRQPRTSRLSSPAIVSTRRLDRVALVGVDRQEGDADGVAPDGGQLEAGDRAEEGVRDLRDDAGAVAGAGVGADGAAVLEVAQRVERGVDDVVPGGAAQRRDHGEAAGVLLVRQGRRGPAWPGHGAEAGMGRRERHAVDRPHSVVDVGMLGAGTPSARCWEGSAARAGPGAARRFVRSVRWDRLDGCVASEPSGIIRSWGLWPWLQRTRQAHRRASAVSSSSEVRVVRVYLSIRRTHSRPGRYALGSRPGCRRDCTTKMTTPSTTATNAAHTLVRMPRKDLARVDADRLEDERPTPYQMR